MNQLLVNWILWKDDYWLLIIYKYFVGFQHTDETALIYRSFTFEKISIYIILIFHNICMLLKIKLLDIQLPASCKSLAYFLSSKEKNEVSSSLWPVLILACSFTELCGWTKCICLSIFLSCITCAFIRWNLLLANFCSGGTYSSDSSFLAVFKMFFLFSHTEMHTPTRRRWECHRLG